MRALIVGLVTLLVASAGSSQSATPRVHFSAEMQRVRNGINWTIRVKNTSQTTFDSANLRSVQVPGAKLDLKGRTDLGRLAPGQQVSRTYFRAHRIPSLPEDAKVEVVIDLVWGKRKSTVRQKFFLDPDYRPLQVSRS